MRHTNFHKKALICEGFHAPPHMWNPMVTHAWAWGLTAHVSHVDSNPHASHTSEFGPIVGDPGWGRDTHHGRSQFHRKFPDCATKATQSLDIFLFNEDNCSISFLNNSLSAHQIKGRVFRVHSSYKLCQLL